MQASPSLWSIETVDAAADVGYMTSLTLDSNDRPHISYYDRYWRNLKYARWTGRGWAIEAVDTPGDVGMNPSLALDSNDRPHISYQDWTNYDLKYARWTGTDWAIEAVETTGFVGDDPSLALDSDGNPHISYGGSTNGLSCLKYAVWTGTDWAIEEVDTTEFVDAYISLALDSDGNPHISYHDFKNRDLKYARLRGTVWDISTVEEDLMVGLFTSLALDSANNPHISYYDWTNGDLKYARWTGTDWDIEAVDTTGDVGWKYTSLALDSDDAPHISYYDNTNGDLKYAVWTGTDWDIEAVDSPGDVGAYSSLALGSDGTTHISYYDNTDSLNGHLKYAVSVEVPPTQRTLMIGVRGAGSTRPPAGTYSYPEGATVSVGAQPATGWIFDHWELDRMDVGSTNPYTVTMDANHALTAVFSEVSPTQYALTITAVVGSGTTDPLPGNYLHDEGSAVTVDALPNAEWMLDHWELDGVNMGDADPITVTMNADHTLTAVFREVPPTQYALTIVVEGSGTTQPAPGTTQRDAGETVVVDAVPDAGWVLDHWELDEVRVGAADHYEVTMDTNHVLAAIFVETLAVQYQLTIEVMGSGTTEPLPGDHRFGEGTGVSVAAGPAPGWMLDHWELDGVDVGDANPYSVMMDGDHTVTAVFTASGNEDDAEPPVAAAGEDLDVEANAAVTFDATASTDNVGIAGYHWDFGDGATGTGATTTHTYADAGRYTVTLTVEDAAGLSDTDTLAVTVTAEADVPGVEWWLLVPLAAIVMGGVVVAVRRRS